MPSPAGSPAAAGNIDSSANARIGLALSGGGFRATLFHLGVVRYLHDARQLAKIDHICSVSGGSILAAHLLLNWNRYTGDASDFEDAADELVQFVRSDLRGWILRTRAIGMLLLSGLVTTLIVEILIGWEYLPSVVPWLQHIGILDWYFPWSLLSWLCGITIVASLGIIIVCGILQLLAWLCAWRFDLTTILGLVTPQNRTYLLRSAYARFFSNTDRHPWWRFWQKTRAGQVRNRWQDKSS